MTLSYSIQKTNQHINRMATLTLLCKPALSFITKPLTKPKVFINGLEQADAVWSSANIYELPAGSYEIKVYIPVTIFMIPICIAKKRIELTEKSAITLRYKLPMLSFLPGSLIPDPIQPNYKR